MYEKVIKLLNEGKLHKALEILSLKFVLGKVLLNEFLNLHENPVINQGYFIEKINKIENEAKVLIKKFQETENMTRESIKDGRTQDALSILNEWAEEYRENDLLKKIKTLNNQNNQTLSEMEEEKINLEMLSLLKEFEEKWRVKEKKMPKPKKGKTKILMLTANPANTTKLNLDKELSNIFKKLQYVKDKFDFIVKDSVNSTEFKEFTETIKPDILHFSGHGEEGGIYLQNDDKNDSELLSTNGLEALFDYFKDNEVQLEAVILNACYSSEQAQAISRYVAYVIGTTINIGDELAIKFSSGFYFKLNQTQKDIEKSFKSGRTEAITSGAIRADFVLYKNGQRLLI